MVQKKKPYRKPRVKKIKVVKVEPLYPGTDFIAVEMEVEDAEPPFAPILPEAPVVVEEVHPENTWVKWLKSLWD
jgi:hypothetical protein